MKLLLLTPQLPYPPHQGTTIRNYNIIRQLARRHEVHLLSFVQHVGELEHAVPLREACRSIRVVPAPHRTTAQRLRNLVTSSLPDMAMRLPSSAFHQELSDYMQRETPDVVQVEGIEMAQYGLALAERRADGGPLLVFDDHNAEYVLQRRAFETDARRPRRWIGAAYSWVQWHRLARYERLTCLRHDWTVAASEADAAAIRQIVPEVKLSIIPNGVDSTAYRLGADFAAGVELPPHSMVFTGKMDFRPNIDGVVWFVHEVLPLIRQQVPDAQFYIVGQKPHPRVAALADEPGVTVTGYVDDVRPYIAQAEAYVVPLRMGGGTRLKIMEAMAMSASVVSTSLGCEGFPLVSGKQLLIEDDKNGFASAVTGLLLNSSERDRLGAEARRFVEAHYDWVNIVPLFDQIYVSR
jgi:sugar transferase (PEP-CTERM/EpsH1 system associated)